MALQQCGFLVLTAYIFVHLPPRFDSLLYNTIRERDQWGDPDVDGRIILRWIFRK
jgi:hypothetical protein